jgi:hypothetical protein
MRTNACEQEPEGRETKKTGRVARVSECSYRYFTVFNILSPVRWTPSDTPT